MYSKKFKVASLFLSLFAVSVIAGCAPSQQSSTPSRRSRSVVPVSSSTTQETSTSKTSTSSKQETSSSSQGESSTSSRRSRSGRTSGGGTQTIKIDFVEAGFGRQFLLDWIEEFKLAYPDTNWNFVLDGNPDMSADFINRLTSGKNLPDIAFILECPWQKYAVQNKLEPLNDIYDSVVEDDKKLSDVMDEICMANSGITTYKGTTYYTIPWSSAPSGIVYNTEMFEQKGWEIPTTTGELYALCDKIVAEGNGIKPFSYASGKTEYWDYLVMTWWIQYNGMADWKTFWQIENKEVFDQEGRLKALQEFAKLSQDKYCWKEATLQDAQKAFINGNAAMTVNASWLENEMRSQVQESGIKMGLMKTPAIEGAKNTEVVFNPSCDCMCIPSLAANKEGAKQFLKFINNKKCNEIFAKKAGGLRPLTNYDPTEIDGISSFTLSCAQRQKEAKASDSYASKLISNPMFFMNTGTDSCSIWPSYGTPYTKMLQMNETPQIVMDNVHNYVNGKWAVWCTNAGR